MPTKTPPASPLVMVDIVIFTVEADALRVLLVRRGVDPFVGEWALPGGAVRGDLDQTLADSARRELIEETGVENPYLEQLYTYGDAVRDPRGWTVSVAWFALVPVQTVTAGTDAADARWFTVDGEGVTETLAFDHARILRDAIRRLRDKLEYTDLAVHLLPETFTLSELQRTYELIMQEKLNKSSFRKRVEKAGMVRAIEGQMRMGSNRPAQLYRFERASEDRLFFPRSIAWARRNPG